MKILAAMAAVPLVILSFTGELGAGTRSWSMNAGTTKFLAIGRPSLLKIRGEGSAPTGSLREENGVVKGQLEVDLNSFKTGIDLRDEHLKNKYLEVARYPKAVLTIDGFKMPSEELFPKEVPFTGTLVLHGESQPVTDGKVKLSKKDGKIAVEARFQITITAHKIGIPSYGGLKVAEKVDVEVAATASPAATPASAN